MTQSLSKRQRREIKQKLCYLNDSRQGELWEANGAGLSVEVFQYQVIQLVDQPVLKCIAQQDLQAILTSNIHTDV